jgi:polyhydroxybutyrate depolymerase
MKYLILSIAALCLLAISGAASRQFRPFQSEAINQSFNVDGVERTALIYTNTKPASKTGAPLVLGFHGHGGRAEFVARRWSLHSIWPEAVVVYLQGLPTATPRDPDGGRPGWQIAPGGQNDRDVRFVDAVIEWARKQYKIDQDRIYAIGHSNGARFATVLWKTRGDKFAAFCSAAAQGGLMIRDATPRSIFAIAGENDRIVRYDGQVRSIEVYRMVLKTDSSKAVTKGYAKIEPGINGTELVTYLHPGGHEFPQEALPLVVDFFKRHSRRRPS